MNETKSATSDGNLHYLSILVSVGANRPSTNSSWVLKKTPQRATIAVLNVPDKSKCAWYKDVGFYYTGANGEAARIPDDKVVVAPIHRNGGSTFEIYILQDNSDAIILYDSGMSEIYLVVNSDKTKPEERLSEYAEKHCMNPYDFFASGVMLPPL